MTTRSQKRKAVAELVSGEFETPVNEGILSEDLIAGPSKTFRIEPENLDEIKTSLRKKILSDLSKILAENQKEMIKLIAPLSKKRPTLTRILTPSLNTSPLLERQHLLKQQLRLALK